VWIAGGPSHSSEFGDLIRAVSHHLSGVILVGAGESDIAQALARHAPDVPVIEVVSLDTGAMVEVVGRAAALAGPGDTVLLSPACAEMGVFEYYRDLGQCFVKAVHALPGFRESAPGDLDE
jgi:UDP-N-acetylmuramoylalanine--D-glutamate ligase